jgi:UDP-glucose 4-epimerase
MLGHQTNCLSKKRKKDLRRILITGGLGFIGSNLVLALEKLGWQVTVLDNLEPSAGGNLRHAREFKKQTRVCYHSILNFEILSDLVREVDVVVNCAAATSHPGSMKEPWDNLDINSRGCLNLLEALRRFNPGVHLIQLGTTTQIGRQIHKIADENHPENPLDIYSANKVAAEKFVRIYHQCYGLPTTVLRLPNVFGPRSAIHSPEFTFNNYFIGQALQARPISVFGDGNQIRNLLHVDDVIMAILLCLRESLQPGEVYQVVSSRHISVLEIAEAVAKACGGPKPQKVPWPSHRRPLEVGNVCLSGEKFRKATGFKEKIEIEAGLKSTVAYFRQFLADYKIEA